MLGYILYVLRGEGYSAVWLVHLKDKGNNSASLKRLGGASVFCLSWSAAAISINQSFCWAF